jgi:hypothetical protein
MPKTALLKQTYLFLALLFMVSVTKAQVLSEGFESPTFPPTGWANVQLNVVSSGGGANVFSYATVTTQTTPNGITAHTGTGMALYDAYNFETYDSAELVTPVLDFSSGGPFRVKLWMYRDERYSASNDSLEIFINATSQTGIGGTKLGTIYRHYLDAPVEAAVGWYLYTFNIPVEFNTTTNYISFFANSDYGTEMVIDDVVVEAQPAGCTGTPSAGTISGQISSCSGFNFDLSNSGATEGAGMAYAWQSSPAATGPWTNVPGQSNFLQSTVSQTSTSFYRFVDTCLNSNLSAISNVIEVTMKPSSQCYCQPPSITLHSFVNNFITNVSIVSTTLNSSNATNFSTGYSLVEPSSASNSASLQQITNYTIEATVIGDPTQVSGWVDFDQSGTFDAVEYFNLVINGNVATGNIAVPSSAIPGPTGLRLRSRAASIIDADACSIFASGETEDYTITVTENSAVNGAIVEVIPPTSGCNSDNTITVKLKNSGSENIDVGAATVTLNISGDNPQGPFTQSNTTLLLPGDTATFVFTGNFPVDGDNEDSAYISILSGDTFYSDDTLVTSHVTLPPPVNAPTSEDFEGTVAGWTVSQIAGSGDWGLGSAIDYPQYTPPYSLTPKSGSTAAVFNTYDFDFGTVSRLTSNCINIPSDAAAGCGYVAGFYFTQDAQFNNLDSVAVKISADGGSSFIRLGKVKRQDSTLATSLATQTYSTPEWKLYTFDVSSYAGQTVQFAFDAYGLFGNNMAIDSFFVGPKSISNNIALSGGTENGLPFTAETSVCTDADGWTYYSATNSSRYLIGVQWDPVGTGSNSAAKAQATANIMVDRKWFSAEDAANQKATYTMQRYWNVDLNGATLDGPVNLRFFYSERELDSIITAKNAFITANPGSFDEGFMWFKTVSEPFIPSNALITPDGVSNAIPLDNVNNGNATINGVLYAQFNGITSFSGGTAASGVGTSTPVPIGLLSFSAQRTGRVNKITWSTSQEINTSHFVIERSNDGQRYSSIGKISAAGNSSTTRNYSFIDNTPERGINYYRLRIVDVDNHEKMSTVKNVRNEGTADVAVYPNPVRDYMQVNITSDKADKATIVITDINGKSVNIQSTRIVEGINYVTLNTYNLSKGLYVIKIQLNEDLIVRKFNKL